MIMFCQTNEGDFLYKHGDMTLTAIKHNALDWEIVIEEHRKLLLPPCHEDYFDDAHCPGGKDLDKVEDFDVCESTCPYVSEIEVLYSHTVFFGGDLRGLAVEAREYLAKVDGQYQKRYVSEIEADFFLGEQWKIGDLIL